MLKRFGVVSALLALVSCGGGYSDGDSSSNPAAPSAPSYSSELAFCWSETNRYRATVGRPALTRSSGLEAYAAAAAREDGTSRSPHRYFNSTNGGGIARAENEIPWWPLSQHGTVRRIIERGLASMWSEGPSGGHYQNMAGSYAQSGCGIFVNGDEVTVVQAFR